MWLPRDERRLLAGYYFRLERPERELWFQAHSWIPVLAARSASCAAKAVTEYGEGPREEPQEAAGSEQFESKVVDSARSCLRVQVANEGLRARGLIKTCQHQTAPFTFGVALSVPGWDLGCKYGNWFTSSGEWFKEYRDHWIWVIVAYLLGILSGLAVNWLS